MTPSQATPGARVTFAVNGQGRLSAGATLSGATLGLPEQIPMSQDSNGNFTISVDLPSDIQAGSYHPSGGGAATGDGTTATTSDSTPAVAGLALIGAGAIAGGFALRRRGARPRG